MKNFHSRLHLPSALACLLFIVTLAGCEKQQSSSAPTATTKTSQETQPTKLVSAEKNSFQEVASHLDTGGNFYLYLGTEQWLEGLSAKVAGWRKFIESIPGVNEEQQGNIAKAFDIVTNLIKDSGLEDISGLGMSSIAREKGLYHSKMMLHHYAGKGSGFFWKFPGQKPHALAGLDLLSTNTALAFFSDFDVPLLWSVVQKEVEKSGFPQAADLLSKAPEAFENATGLKLDKVLSSLGGEFGFVLTLNEAKKISIPLPTGTLELPEPGLLLAIKVNDDTIFNRVDGALKQLPFEVVSDDKPEAKSRTVAVPLPLPIELRPTITTSGGYLLIATSDAVIQDALAVKAGRKPGIKSTDEFKKLATDIPMQGNSFGFVGQRFGQALLAVQQQALQMNDNTPQAIRDWVKSVFKPGAVNHSFSVGANTEQGWLSVGNSSQDPVKAIAAVAVIAPVGILAAIAVPNFVKARSTAQKNACINNLRQIDGAKQQWALENKKTDSDTPTRAELLGYFHSSQFPVCPAGGRYTMNPVSRRPECSMPGHALPE